MRDVEHGHLSPVWVLKGNLIGWRTVGPQGVDSLQEKPSVTDSLSATRTVGPQGVDSLQEKPRVTDSLSMNQIWECDPRAAFSLSNNAHGLC